MILALCAVIAGGITTWFVTRDDSPDFCRGLAKDSRVQQLVAAAHQTDPDCAALGRVLKKATMQGEEEKHSIKQAQAMKGTLLAVDDHMQRSGIASLNEEFSSPLADALVEYSIDVYKILAPGSFDYSKRDSPSDPPWEDENGAHVSIFQKPLMRVIRGLSATPSAYAELRLGVTRSAAHALATTPESAINADGSLGPSGPKVNAWPLGALDVIADNVTDNLSKERAAEWKNRVFADLTQETSLNFPSYGNGAEQNIVVTWKNLLKSTGSDHVVTHLHEQGPVLVKAWGKGIQLSEKRISLFADEARFSAESSRGTMSHYLR
ncbi:hypothetical protein ACIBCO_38415 [Streptomyces violascens]|uniref:hypothetical protein n=1 Tax=Streptomyces violascens TaxID=67381 RepID=UPI0037AB9DFD